MTMDYDDWHKKIQATLEWRENYWNGMKAWKRYMSLYIGDHWKSGRTLGIDEPSSERPNDRITVNVTGSTILLAKSFLVKSNPKFIIKPRKPEDVISVQLKEEAVNYEWKERDVQSHMRDAVLDSLIIGHGIVKIGFTFERPKYRKKSDGNADTREYIQKNSPYVERVNPFRFIFDIEGENFRKLDNGRWCAEIFFQTKKAILGNAKYNKSVLKEITDNVSKPDTYPSPLVNKGETYDLDNSGLIPCYEVWDKEYYKRYVFAAGVENALIDEEWPYDYLEGFPYEKIDFIPMPNEHYGLGIPAFIEDQQLELNRVRTSMFDHRRRFNRKYQYVKGSVDDEEIQKLISGETGTVIALNEAGGITPIQEGTIPSDAFNVEGVIKGDIRELTGTDELARGGSLPSRTSAAEIQARQQYQNLKLDDRVNDTDKLFMNVGRKLIQHISANYDSSRLQKISGVAGTFWVRATKEDIQGEFDMEMETVSAPKTDELTDRQQAIQIFQMVMQNIQALGQSVNVPEMFKWLFAKFGEKDISRFFSPAATISGPIQTQAAPQGNGAINASELSIPSTPTIDMSQLREGMMGSLNNGGIQ